jgi:hypothetical protein
VIDATLEDTALIRMRTALLSQAGIEMALK